MTQDGSCAPLVLAPHGGGGSARSAPSPHERMTVRMELAALHHSRDGGRETYYGLRAPKTASSVGRPDILKEPEPPSMVDRVLRHTVEQRMEQHLTCSRRRWNSWWISRIWTARCPCGSWKQISQDIIPQCCVDLLPQTAEQLGSTDDHLLFFSVAVDCGEQIIETIFRGGPQGFHPGQSSSSSLHRPVGISEDTDDPGDGGFSHFSPWKKKVRSAGQVSADLPGTSAHGPRRLVCSPGVP